MRPSPPLAYALVGMKSEALDPLQGALHRRTMQTKPLGEFRERGLGLLPTSVGNKTDHVRLPSQATTTGLPRSCGLSRCSTDA